MDPKYSVEIYDYDTVSYKDAKGNDVKSFCIAMEYMDGWSLEYYLKN